MTYRLVIKERGGPSTVEDGLSADVLVRLVGALDRFVPFEHLVVHSIPDRSEVFRWQPEHGPFDVKGLELTLSAHERVQLATEPHAVRRFSPLPQDRFLAAARNAVRMPVPARLPAEDELLVDEHRRDQERPDA